MNKNKKIIILIAACLLIISIGIGFLVVHPFILINGYQKKYDSLSQGVTLEQVKKTMGSSYSVWDGPVLFWGDKSIKSGSAEDFRFSIGYTVKTFFLPVSFAFSFDSSDRLVGKHRYD